MAAPAGRSSQDAAGNRAHPIKANRCGDRDQMPQRDRSERAEDLGAALLGA